MCGSEEETMSQAAPPEAGRIEDYGLIGDLQTAALVGRDGSIDWLCVPRFDFHACFAALLGASEHGRWKLAPTGEITRVDRRYRRGTLVLETDFETGGRRGSGHRLHAASRRQDGDRPR